MPPQRQKAAGKSRAQSRKSATGSKRVSRKSAAQSPLMQLRIPPKLQREIFAVGLVLIGLLTLIFSLSDDPGTIGRNWNDAVRQAFGRGAVLVPLALGIIGALIIWQERLQDERLSGAHVLGTILILVALLMLLEYPLLDKDPAFYVGQGGGVVGHVLLTLLSTAIGRPGALLVSLSAGLIGIMLTFNLTLRELAAGAHYHTIALWRRLLGTGQHIRMEEPESEQELPAAPRRQRSVSPDDQDLEDLVLTPIAERPAHARLFERPGRRSVEPAKNGRTRPAKPTPATLDAVQEERASEPRAESAKSPQPQQLPLSAAQDDDSDEALTTDGAHRAWPLPALDLLDQYTEGEISDEEKREKARIIEETLASFKVEARVVEVNTGPAVTQFALQPAVGVKISKITTLQSDLALALAAPSIRIEAPVPGRSVVGIEIPNSAISLVSLREVMESDEFNASKARLKIPLGKDVSGTSVVADMTRMPHLLVAGATGSGKSICINAILCSLLLRHTPDELKFIMVDPKMVELIVYNNIPHLLTPVITELERVVNALKWATREMERRYKLFAQKGFRNLESYNKAARKRPDLEPMPYILVIIDELADLMMMAPDEVETLICRLAQMARATGIHLIIATQRPSVDVVTGLIKANFPSRIAFAVTSQVDSRVILDTPGAEQLLGRGDALYLASDASKPIRLQGTYVSDGEVERVVRFWRAQRPPENGGEGEAGDDAGHAASGGQQSAASAESRQSAGGTTMGDTFLSAEEQDELLPKAIELVRQHQRASASLLQRRLRIGYSKAAQLIDLLEQRGIVGPPESGRSREVLRNTFDE